jgi:hypothetical protein
MRSQRAFGISLFMPAGAIAQRTVGDRYPSNHCIVMVQMDKIVSKKRGWVYLFQPNLEGRAIALWRRCSDPGFQVEWLNSLNALEVSIACH